MSVVL
jgi:hypothetical protein